MSCLDAANPSRIVRSTGPYCNESDVPGSGDGYNRISVDSVKGGPQGTTCSTDVKSFLGDIVGAGSNYVRYYGKYTYDYPQDTMSKFKCCTGETPQNRCAPGSCPGAVGCNELYESVCDINALSNPSNPNYKSCNMWCATHKDKCNGIKNIACNDVNLVGDNPVCRSYAIANGGLDDVVAKFCETNPGDTMCSCKKNTYAHLTDDTISNQINQSPECFDPACKNSGYRTDTQRTGSCPALASCVNRINIGGKITNANISDIKQSCGKEINQLKHKDGGNTSNTSSMGVRSLLVNAKNNIINGFNFAITEYRYALIFILILVLVASVYVYYYDPSFDLKKILMQ